MAREYLRLSGARFAYDTAKNQLVVSGSSIGVNIPIASTGSKVQHVVRKTSDTTVINSVVGSGDPHLSFPVAASDVWKVKATCFFDVGAGGAAVFLTGSAVPTLYYVGDSISGRLISGSALGSTVVQLQGAQATTIVLDGTINVNTAGTVGVGFNQYVSNGAATVLKSLSTIEATRISP